MAGKNTHYIARYTQAFFLDYKNHDIQDGKIHHNNKNFNMYRKLDGDTKYMTLPLTFNKKRLNSIFSENEYFVKQVDDKISDFENKIERSILYPELLNFLNSKTDGFHQLNNCDLKKILATIMPLYLTSKSSYLRNIYNKAFKDEDFHQIFRNIFIGEDGNKRNYSFFHFVFNCHLFNILQRNNSWEDFIESKLGHEYEVFIYKNDNQNFFLGDLNIFCGSGKEIYTYIDDKIPFKYIVYPLTHDSICIVQSKNYVQKNELIESLVSQYNKIIFDFSSHTLISKNPIVSSDINLTFEVIENLKKDVQPIIEKQKKINDDIISNNEVENDLYKKILLTEQLYKRLEAFYDIFNGKALYNIYSMKYLITVGYFCPKSNTFDPFRNKEICG